MKIKFGTTCFVIGMMLAPVVGYTADSDTDRSVPVTFIKDSVITTKIKTKLAAKIHAENMMLAACAIGLGSCVIGSSVEALNTPEVKAKLDIPGEFNAVAPIIVGVPRGETATPSRKEPLILAWKQ
jgi:nitroreductase